MTMIELGSSDGDAVVAAFKVPHENLHPGGMTENNTDDNVANARRAASSSGDAAGKGPTRAPGVKLTDNNTPAKSSVSTTRNIASVTPPAQQQEAAHKGEDAVVTQQNIPKNNVSAAEASSAEQPSGGDINRSVVARPAQSVVEPSSKVQDDTSSSHRPPTDTFAPDDNKKKEADASKAAAAETTALHKSGVGSISFRTTDTAIFPTAASSSSSAGGPGAFKCVTGGGNSSSAGTYHKEAASSSLPDKNNTVDATTATTLVANANDAFLQKATQDAAATMAAMKEWEQAAQQAQIILSPQSTKTSSANNKRSSTKKRKAVFTTGKQKRRNDNANKKIHNQQDNNIPVIPTPNDVLLGRGGVGNAHPGNLRYRQHVVELNVMYKSLQDREDKTRMSEGVVEWVHSNGGRFLKRSPDERYWYEVTFSTAREKCSQALRDDYSSETRRAVKKYGRVLGRSSSVVVQHVPPHAVKQSLQSHSASVNRGNLFKALSKFKSSSASNSSDSSDSDVMSIGDPLPEESTAPTSVAAHADQDDSDSMLPPGTNSDDSTLNDHEGKHAKMEEAGNDSEMDDDASLGEYEDDEGFLIM